MTPVITWNKIQYCNSVLTVIVNYLWNVKPYDSYRIAVGGVNVTALTVLIFYFNITSGCYTTP